MNRDRKTAVIVMTLTGNLKTSKFFKDLNKRKRESLAANKAEYEEQWKRLQDSAERHGDEGFDGQRRDLGDSYLSTQDSIKKEYDSLRDLYTRACTIEIKEEHLFFPITAPIPYGLTLQQKEDLLKAHSTETDKAEEVLIGKMQFILFKAKTELPKKFKNKNPREDEDFQDWILNILRNNLLFAALLATEWASDLKYQIA